MLTKQQYFDQGATHLFTQGHRSTLNGERCAYRAPDGSKCLVGAFIPDESYDPDMENLNVIAMVHQFPKLKQVLGTETDFLRSLQRCHDDERNWYSTERMRAALDRVGTHCGVDTSILATLSFKDR